MGLGIGYFLQSSPANGRFACLKIATFDKVAAEANPIHRW
jgi:hypothetical protein